MGFFYSSLFHTPGLETYELTFPKLGHNLNRITAHLTILYIGLSGNRGVKQHGNFLPTIRALKKLFVHNARFKTKLPKYLNLERT